MAISQNTKKVLILHNIIVPYRVHLFNAMNKYFQIKNIKFKVIFLSESDKNRHWENFDIKFDYDILKNSAIRVGRKDLFTFFINRNISDLLTQENPDKIICFGWDHLAAYISNFWARKHKKEFIMWSGSTDYENSWRRSLFKPLVQYIVRNSTWCIGDGTRHKEYLLHLGANPSKTEVFYCQADIYYFESKISAFTSIEKHAFKSNLGIRTSKLILFNGQLIHRKGIYELLKGFKLYQQNDPSTSLLLLGRGPEKNKIIEFIQLNSIQQVFFQDFVQYDDVYKFYTISDLLILPSNEEAWGLVINEAMICGLPIIATDRVGASVDLIKDGQNGYVIKVNCPECIADAIAKIYVNQLNTKNNSQEIIRQFSFENMIQSAKFMQL